MKLLLVGGKQSVVFIKNLKLLQTLLYMEKALEMDMQYHDLVDGTTTWQDSIQAVKDANPKV